MPFRMRSTLVVTAFVALAIVGPSADQQKPVFRTGREDVRVFTTVKDRNNRLVTTLTQEHFEIRDGGKAQPITLFDNTPQPIRLIVMLDISVSMRDNLPLLRAAGTQLLSRLREDDVARVGSFGKEIKMSTGFSRDPREFEAVLPEEIPKVASTPLWEALHIALNGFQDGAGARKVIVVLTDGQDTSSLTTAAAIIDEARRDDVMIYAVWMEGRNGKPAPVTKDAAGVPTLASLQTERPEGDFMRVADQTGGGFVRIAEGDDLVAAFAAIADELHMQYLIGFAPPKRDGLVHEIDVRVTHGMKARSRKSYVAPKG